jgi:hypothetical protein
VDLKLVRDDFSGAGDITSSPVEEDVHGGAWKTVAPLSGPTRSGDGKLLSGGPNSVAAIALPPISPHGELTVTARLQLQSNDQWLGLGFTDSVHRLSDTSKAVWARFRGDGKVDLQDHSSPAQTAVAGPGNGPMRTVTAKLIYNIGQNRVTTYIDDIKAHDSVATTSPLGAPYRYFAIEFPGDTTQGSPSVDSILVEYIPRPRPLKMVANTTLTVTDTTAAGITSALKEAQKIASPTNIVEVSIPKGDYLFNGGADPQIFWVFSLNNMIINWNNSSITLADPKYGLMMLSSTENCTVKNIASIDYPADNLPFTQGTVTAVNASDGTFDLEIDSGFPSPMNAYFTKGRELEDWGQFIDPKIPGRAAGKYLEYWVTEVTPLGGQLYRYKTSTALDGVAPGFRFADLPRGGGYELFRVMESKDITLENITVYSASGFVTNSAKTTALNFIDVDVRIKPGRIMSTNADVATGRWFGIGVWIENSYFEGSADDICHQMESEGIFVTHSTFKNNRRYGVWFNNSQHGVVKDSTFEGIGREAILGFKDGLTGVYSSKNIIVHNNTITASRTAPISTGDGYQSDTGDSQLNTYWRIINNTIDNPGGPGVLVRNADDVLFFGNDITARAGDPTVRVEWESCGKIAGVP